MSNYTLFVDSDCDFNLDDCKYYRVKMISMPYIMNGKLIKPYEDFEKFDFHSFYNILRDGIIPSTCGISEEIYKKYFECEFANGKDILYVHFSRAMTISFNSMDRAVNKLLQKYPERKFYDIDTKGITTLGYIIAKEVCEQYKEGKTAEEILKWSETEVQKYAMYFFADDIRFFKHSGRVNGLGAMIGTILGIRPIITITDEGIMKSVGTEKGRKKTIEAIISKLNELGDSVETHRIVIGHTDAQDLAEEVENKIKEKYGKDINIEIRVVNPTAGSHCGPNGVGVCFHAIYR